MYHALAHITSQKGETLDSMRTHADLCSFLCISEHCWFPLKCLYMVETQNGVCMHRICKMQHNAILPTKSSCTMWKNFVQLVLVCVTSILQPRVGYRSMFQIAGVAIIKFEISVLIPKCQMVLLVSSHWLSSWAGRLHVTQLTSTVSNRSHVERKILNK